ncbi:DUF4192 family protein [Nesterenkonia muleiensis]|uniref:DUF4192 family protein n=1 Tax=Nesterenkonia muleiensis TaxID=2282648 RepID=UPI0013002E0A|nr:DUF4192 family protein [Nesterenkonia muleiensis]
MTSTPTPQNPEPALNAADPLSIEEPGDVLALVQHTFGYVPEDSLVLIGLMNGTTGGHLRVDLSPALDKPHWTGERCASWIAGPDASPVPEAVLAVIFDTQAPDPDAPDRHDVLLSALAEGLLTQAEARLIKVWHCGEGSIRDYDCCDADCCPYPGQDVQSTLAGAQRRVPALARTRAFSPEECVEAFLSVSPLITEEQIGRVRRHSAPAPELPEAVLTIWDAALCRGIREAGGAGRADCGWIQSSPARMSALLGTLDSPAHTGLLMALTTSGIETTAARRLLSDGNAAELGHTVWGTSEVPPRWERVDALDSLLHQLVPFAEGCQLEQILGLKAWTEWIRGRGSNATAIAEMARELDPERWDSQSDPPLARTVLQCINRLGVCPWAQVKQSSYSWWSGNR